MVRAPNTGLGSEKPVIQNQTSCVQSTYDPIVNSEVADIEQALQSRDPYDCWPQLRKAAQLGPVGEQVLIDALMSKSDPRDQVLLGAFLGEATGPSGPTVLRTMIERTGPGTQDLRLVALLALAKRCGVAATPDLQKALSAKNASVRHWAVIGLAGAGDDRAWDDVFDRLRRVLEHPSHTLWSPSDVLWCVLYLGQYCADAPDRMMLLVGKLRRSWNLLSPSDVSQLQRLWPGLEPTGDSMPQTPEPAALRAYARDLMFKPL